MHTYTFFRDISLRGDTVTMPVERRQSKHVIDIVWFMYSKSADGHCTITKYFQSLHPWAIVEVHGGEFASVWSTHWYASREKERVRERERERGREQRTRWLLRISNFRYWQLNEPGNVAYAFLPSCLLMCIRFLSWFSTIGDVCCLRYSTANDRNIRAT